MIRSQSLHSLVLAIGLGAAVFTVSTTASALVPPTITHQGRLFDAGGVPVTGNFDIDFAIYDAVDAVAPIWMETHNIDIDEGYLAGGVSVVVAAVLLAVGGRRMARAPSRTALVPVPGGLALHARF